MRRTTITLPDDLSTELERYLADLEPTVPVSGAIQAALREYLARRGYAVAGGRGPFQITPATQGSGAADSSVEHDRYIAEAARAE